MNIDTKKLRELAEAIASVMPVGSYGRTIVIQADDVIAILERIDSLEQTAQRRLEDMELMSKELAAMTAARDSAAKIARNWIELRPPGLDTFADVDLTDLHDIEKVGGQ